MKMTAIMPLADWKKVLYYGGQHDVDPLLIAAIGWHETHWGRLGAGLEGYHLGYGVTDSGRLTKYAGLDQQLEYGARKLGKWGMRPGGVVTLAFLRQRNNPANNPPTGIWATDPLWPDKVWAVYRNLEQDYPWEAGGGGNGNSTIPTPPSGNNYPLPPAPSQTLPPAAAGNRALAWGLMALGGGLALSAWLLPE